MFIETESRLPSASESPALESALDHFRKAMSEGSKTVESASVAALPGCYRVDLHLAGGSVARGAHFFDLPIQVASYLNGVCSEAIGRKCFGFSRLRTFTDDLMAAHDLGREAHFAATA